MTDPPGPIQVVGQGASPPPRPPSGGRIAAVVSAVAGLAIGFVLAASVGGGAPGVGDTAPATAPVLAEGTTSLPPPPTTPRTIARSQRSLSFHTPTFGGALYLITGEPESPQVWVWPTTTTAPRLVAALPPTLLPGTVRFDAGRGTLAALGQGVGGRVLLAGPPDALTPLAFDVTGFAWHERDARRLAFTAIRDGETVLHTLDLDVVTQEGITTATEVATVAGREVVAWGHWGYLVQRDAFVTDFLDPSGTPLVEAALVVMGAANTNPVVLPSLDTPLADPFDGGSLDDVLQPTALTTSVVVSTARDAVARIEQTGSGTAELRIGALGGSAIEATIVVPPSRILDWTVNGRYLLLESLISRIDSDRVFRPLYLVELDRRCAVYEIPMELSVSAAAIATAQGGRAAMRCDRRG